MVHHAAGGDGLRDPRGRVGHSAGQGGGAGGGSAGAAAGCRGLEEPTGADRRGRGLAGRPRREGAEARPPTHVGAGRATAASRPDPGAGSESMTGPSFRDVFAAEPKTVVTVTGRVSGYPCQVASFVDGHQYAGNFGKQWARFRDIQLDSVNGTMISKAYLEELIGFPIERLAGKTVLEIGARAGRFTEYFVKHAKLVVAVDLSEAIFVNTALGSDNLIPAQANLLVMPPLKMAFDRERYAEPILRFRWKLGPFLPGRTKRVLDFVFPVYDYRGFHRLTEYQLIEWGKLDRLDALFARYDNPMTCEEVLEVLWRLG